MKLTMNTGALAFLAPTFRERQGRPVPTALLGLPGGALRLDNATSGLRR